MEVGLARCVGLGRVPLAPSGCIWGAARGTTAPGLNSSMEPVGTWSLGVSDATAKIKRQSSRTTVSHATVVSKWSDYALALFPGKEFLVVT